MELESIITKLSRDLKKASYTLSDDEARFLVDSYYNMQENRIRSASQVRELSKSGEPHEVLVWFENNADTLEQSIKTALDAYSGAHPVGSWARSVVGIGPVTAAGLLAHIDITKAPTAGHIWNFAGLNPSVKWAKGQKRPWNGALKTLCWKIGESFVKTHNNEDAFYGKVYKERKDYEMDRNLAGQLAEQAAAVLATKNIGKDTDAYAWYSGSLTRGKAAQLLVELKPGAAKKAAGKPGSGVPMLPPAHIHARAKRAAVKLFLSHLHHVWFTTVNGVEPPRPYALEHLGHAHYLAPPNWPMTSSKPQQ